MTNLGASAAWGLLIGSSLFVGAIAAAGLKLPARLAAEITAVGGGILLAAIAFELVPEADAQAGTLITAAGMSAGTFVYVGTDTWLTRDAGNKDMRRSAHAAAAGKSMSMKDHSEAARGESIAAGLFVDGVPESLALGLTIAGGAIGVSLLAGIVIGNIVEAYGAAQPIVAGGHSKRFAIGLMGGIGVSLAAATVLGGTLLAGASPLFIGAAQAVAAGAILAVVSISVIPYAFEEVDAASALATALGFVAGYLLS